MCCTIVIDFSEGVSQTDDINCVIVADLHVETA